MTFDCGMPEAGGGAVGIGGAGESDGFGKGAVRCGGKSVISGELESF